MKLLKKIYSEYFMNKESKELKDQACDSSWKISRKTIIIGDDLSLVKQIVAERENSTLYTVGSSPSGLNNSFALKLHNIQIKPLGSISDFFEVLMSSSEYFCLYMSSKDVISNEFILRRLSKARKEIRMIWAYSEPSINLDQMNLLRDLCNIVVIKPEFQQDSVIALADSKEIYQASSSQIPSHLSLV